MLLRASEMRPRPGRAGSALWIAIFCALCGAAPTLDGPSRLPRVVIGPPNEGALRELFNEPDQWSELRRHVGGLLYADHNFKRIADEELRRWFSELSGWGIRLELEVGAIKEWSATGAGTFEKERGSWDRVRALGGDFSSIAMDEPLTAARKFLHLPDEYAVAQTVEFIRLVRQHYPSLRIGDVEPFPFIPVEQHERWLSRLQQALSAIGVRGLDFYRIDPNWAAFAMGRRGSWQDLKAIHQFCGSLGIPMSLIYWASDYPVEKQRGVATDETWYRGLMTEAAGFAQTDDKPDQYVVESWVGAPLHAVPDRNPLTFTGSALAFVRRFVEP